MADAPRRRGGGLGGTQSSDSLTNNNDTTIVRPTTTRSTSINGTNIIKQLQQNQQQQKHQGRPLISLSRVKYIIIIVTGCIFIVATILHLHGFYYIYHQSKIKKQQQHKENVSAIQKKQKHQQQQPRISKQQQPEQQEQQQQDTKKKYSVPITNITRIGFDDDTATSTKNQHLQQQQQKKDHDTKDTTTTATIGKSKLSSTTNDQNEEQSQVVINKNDDERYNGIIVPIQDWTNHIQQTINYQTKYGIQSIRKYITAFIEPWYIFNTTIPGTGSRGDMKKDNDGGIPPDYIIPLPLRTHTPKDLKKYEYKHAATTCYEMPGKFPIDPGLQYDTNTGEVIVWNVGDQPTPPNYPWEEANYCPVEADPFLPWIHDVFPAVPIVSSSDANNNNNNNNKSMSIHIIAQNRRKCRTGAKFTENVNRLVPQVTLLQSISVQRINETMAQQLAPSLWTKNGTGSVSSSSQQTRYRLVPYEEADPDGMYTRFICQFHTTIYENDDTIPPRTVLIGETLSSYPFNYEMVSYRKGNTALLTPKGKDTTFFWTSNLHFECPIPEPLQLVIGTGQSMLQTDGTPTIHLDIIPIRTAVRYQEIHLTEDLIGPKKDWALPAFDAKKHWGSNQVLPRIEASGRWTNIPICYPPQQPPPLPKDDNKIVVSKAERQLEIEKENSGQASKNKKPHYLSACLWASASFKTRGIRKGGDTATNDRLIEWIEFHLMAGFDHIYIYDNSGAHTNTTSLQPVIDQFHPSQVTRIDWPSTICNNNVPAADSTGERSTQYAAESSCRSRFAPYTEWIASFDTDEYFVPMGEYTNLKDLLYDVSKQGTKILSFRSSRGRLRMDKSTAAKIQAMNPKIDYNKTSRAGYDKSPDSLYLEAYNCDSAGSPKPSWGDRARKQIYKSDYVLYHFVHYATVTQEYMITYKNGTDAGENWRPHHYEHYERNTDEFKEAVLVHTKTLTGDHLKSWQETCRYDYPKKWKGCWAAIPWPGNITLPETTNQHNTNLKREDENGFGYNCFINRKVENYWIPKLKKAMHERKLLSNGGAAYD